MAKARGLTTLGDAALRKAHLRAWQQYSEVALERNRRGMLNQYGSERPDLPEYEIELAITVPIIVRASSEQEATDIARTDICLLTENIWQIEFTDDPTFRAQSAALILDIADAEAAE